MLKIKYSQEAISWDWVLFCGYKWDDANVITTVQQHFENVNYERSLA
ncbi:hypothetical protein [Nodularia sp. UHCC 0506]|nr:hypothetical protein [Nodularia sp. UHCC 0506]MEA5517116.1 hypothetical protein [Nodularia sp. UHCC 0506]